MYFKIFNEAGRKICRQDGYGDLFSASLSKGRQGIHHYTETLFRAERREDWKRLRHREEHQGLKHKPRAHQQKQ